MAAFVFSLLALSRLGQAALFHRQASPVNTPAPMLEPAYPSCEQFHLAGNGEDCNAIIGASGLERAEFFRINPAVGGETHCQDKIMANTWYCVKARPDGGSHPPPVGVKPAAPTAQAHPFNAPHNPYVKPTANSKPTHTEVKPSPAPTWKPTPLHDGPPSDGHCWSDACYKAFVDLSASGNQEQEQASAMCTQLFNKPCKDDLRDFWGFPGDVLKGCKDCAMLSSGCPCYTEGHYVSVPVWDINTGIAHNHPGNWRPYKEKRDEVDSAPIRTAGGNV